jgi:hypothetical protein
VGGPGRALAAAGMVFWLALGPAPAVAQAPSGGGGWRPWTDDVAPRETTSPSPTAPRNPPPGSPRPAARPESPAGKTRVRSPAPPPRVPTRGPTANPSAPAAPAAAPAGASTVVATPAPPTAAPPADVAVPSPASPPVPPPPPPAAMAAPRDQSAQVVAPAASAPGEPPSSQTFTIQIGGPSGTTGERTLQLQIIITAPGATVATAGPAAAAPPAVLARPASLTAVDRRPGDPGSPPSGAPAPAPYSLPWQLRSALLGNVARLDTLVASDRDDQGKPGLTQVGNLIVTRKLGSRLMPLFRVGAVHNVPASGASGSVLLNPVLGLALGAPLRPGLHAAALVAITPPLGTGAGNGASAQARAALRTGGAARSAMDGAMFAVNDLGLLLGGDLAYLRQGATLQIEATLIQLRRLRGAALQPDRDRTNLTSGIHAGYFLIPALSLGGELRYQRWLSTPAAVAADPTGASRDTVTAALGVRFHLRAGSGWVRPGVSLGFALDQPLASRRPGLLQIDLPVAL